MNKKFLLLFLLLFLLTGCNGKVSEEDILNEFLENFTYSLENEEFDLVSEVNYNDNVILIEWEFSNKILDENNKLIHYEDEVKSRVTIKATLGKYTKSKELGEIVSKSKEQIEIEENEVLLNEFLNQFIFSQTSDYIIDLENSINYNGKDIALSWSFSEDILDSNNFIIHKENEYEVDVILKASIGSVTLEKIVGKVKSISLNAMKEKYSTKEKEVLDKFKEEFQFKQTNDETIEFVYSFVIDDNIINLSYEYDKNYINANGTLIHQDERKETEIFVIASFGGSSERISLGKVVIKSAKELINEVINSINVPQETDCDISLLKKINGVDIEWYSDDEDILSNEGKCSFVDEEKELIITAFFSCENEEIEKEYKIIVKPYSVKKRFELVLESIELPYNISSDIELKTEYSYGVSAVWESSKKSVISDSGKVTLNSESVNVVLKLKLYIGEEKMEKEFSVKTVATKKMNLHYFVEKTNDFEKENMFNLEVKDDRVSLMDGEIYGYYDSAIYETLNFEELVGSWAAISSTSATCELLIKIRVNGKWSKYFTYGIWGLGRNNLYYNQKDTNAKMNVDEIVPINGMGDAFQYRIILRRDSKDVESPKLGLVAITIRIPDYEYKVDVSGLNSFVDYDVAKVNQNVVPVIGNSICSATTSTMLLKYKGFDFSEFDEYENRYIANLVADRGHNSPTYGNWVYNTVTMGAYGLSSYVKHMYSWDELKLHLATVGPVGASISGNTGLYTTAGHLIVVRGYREVDGKTYVICNDPNINERFGNDSDGNPLFVYYEFPLETFMNFWRGTVYVVE